ncbi:MAG: EAL domain-containing protein [Pseudomonadota bacterium]
MAATMPLVKRIMLLVGGILVITVTGLYATTLLGWSALTVVAVCAAVVFVAVVISALISLSRRVADLQRRSLDVGGYESDISRRVSQLSAQIDGLKTSPQVTPENVGLSSKIDHLQDEVRQIRRMVMAQDTPKARAVPDKPEEASENSDKAEGSNASRGITLPVALSNDDLRLHLQPIVNLSDRKPTLFQASMRLRLPKEQTSDDAIADGHMPQTEFIRMAEGGGLMPLIDKKILFMSVRMLRALGGEQHNMGLVCNLSRQTLSDDRVFAQVHAFLDANRKLTKAVILELSQRGYREMKRTERYRLGQLVDLGYRLSLGDVADLTIDPAALAAQGFHYMTVEAAILLHGDMDDGTGVIPAQSLASRMAQHGITVVATQVDRENQALSVIDADVTLSQGLLFSPPRPVKRELLETQSSPQDAEIRRAS